MANDIYIYREREEGLNVDNIEIWFTKEEVKESKMISQNVFKFFVTKELRDWCPKKRILIWKSNLLLFTAKIIQINVEYIDSMIHIWVHISSYI